MTSDSELLFAKDGVFIHVTTAQADEDVLLHGQVCLWQKRHGVFLEWKPVDELEEKSNEATDWTVVHAEMSSASVSFKQNNGGNSPGRARSSVSSQAAKYVVNFDIKDLKTFRRSKPSLGWSYLIFILKCGTTFPALHFHYGGTKNVIQELRKFLHIKTSPHDSCLYLVTDVDSQALFKSYDELQLFDKQNDLSSANDVFTKFMQDPVTATFGGFSKVTHFLRETLLTPDQPGLTADIGSDVTDGIVSRYTANTTVTCSTELQGGFEIVTARELPPLPKVNRSEPVTSEQWSSYMDSDGRVTDAEAVKERIFRGGVDKAIRTEAWKFLLNYYDWNSTYKMRTELRKQKVDDYFCMKLQWKSMSLDQESRFTDLRERKSLIEKDVSRTDRTHKFFQGENNPNIGVLYDILMTHCMYNFDLGYVQGMSDLLAPVLVVMENEVDAFWCFAGFIQMMGANFEKDQQSMKDQLGQLRVILEFYDPELANYLESQESNNMFFCFRWLLILFKREFSFPDIMKLWEVLWTSKPCRNFHLIICLSIIISEKTTIMENNFGFTEILKHINDMSGTLNVDKILENSEAIYLQLRDCRELPDEIHSILSISSRSSEPFSSALQPATDTLSNSHQASFLPNGNHRTVTQTLHCGDTMELNKCNSASPDVETPAADDSSIEVLSECI